MPVYLPTDNTALGLGFEGGKPCVVVESKPREIIVAGGAVKGINGFRAKKVGRKYVQTQEPLKTKTAEIEIEDHKLTVQYITENGQDAICEVFGGGESIISNYPLEKLLNETELHNIAIAESMEKRGLTTELAIEFSTKEVYIRSASELRQFYIYTAIAQGRKWKK